MCLLTPLAMSWVVYHIDWDWYCLCTLLWYLVCLLETSLPLAYTDTVFCFFKWMEFTLHGFRQYASFCRCWFLLHKLGSCSIWRVGIWSLWAEVWNLISIVMVLLLWSLILYSLQSSIWCDSVFQVFCNA